MITYKKGNLLEAETEAYVNTVNTVGVMGKGIALQFKERFPLNFKLYAAACKKGEVVIGKMFVTRELSLEGEKTIINFPTKTVWFKKSQYAFIEEGLKNLVEVIHHYKIKSIAVPPLGCGNGGLVWEKVKPLIENQLKNLHIKIIIFEPEENKTVKKTSEKEHTRKPTKLNPARAMLLHALYTYVKIGEDASVFAVNKLAYFLQRSGEDLKMEFVGHHYGPYAKDIEKVLAAFNGQYFNGFDERETKAFEPFMLDFDKLEEVEKFVETQLSNEQKERLANLYTLIKGFESTLSLEILASVDFLRTREKNISEDKLFDQIQGWNERKKNLVKREHIAIALQHLEKLSPLLNHS